MLIISQASVFHDKNNSKIEFGKYVHISDCNKVLMKFITHANSARGLYTWVVNGIDLIFSVACGGNSVGRILRGKGNSEGNKSISEQSRQIIRIPVRLQCLVCDAYCNTDKKQTCARLSPHYIIKLYIYIYILLVLLFICIY